jgi:hypothetical protein
MKVLVACEYSGRVREAFRSRGHDAWSCDLLPAEDGSEFHLQGDALEVIDGGCPARSHSPYMPAPWDLMVAHPPCTYLAASGMHWTTRGLRDKALTDEAAEFFLALASAPIPRIAIENPIGHMSGLWREPDQIIQPWEFGEDASKATCLWLKGLPRLIPTKVIRKRRYANQTESGQNKLAPSDDRWKERSRTYRGIADAMAAQWSNYSDLVTLMEAA